ncbi:MAG: UvrD-helicase domain-containing protein [Candidatus Erginobacter occultus]|nr:UvrD-helicase domain-containing protein [Candidatus Erginobacter occultus]
MEEIKKETKIKLIRASAGTGKTYSLTEELHNRLKAGELEPERIIAVTFTRAAAGELRERVRSRLFKERMPEEAQRVEAALIGTVHSVCERILKRFAFEAGISPDIQTLPEEEASASFKVSLSGALSRKELAGMAEITSRLSIEDWEDQSRQIADKARINGIGPEKLRAMAGRAEEAFLRYFPPPSGTGAEAADRILESALDTAIRDLDTIIKSGEDKYGNTRDYLALLRQFRRRFGNLTWNERAKLSSKAPAKKSLAAAEPVIAASREDFAHPRLREDIGAFIQAVYSVAADALESYENWKRDRAYIDFTDMEAGTLKLLENPAVADSLAGEFDLLMVDEFQDTSPLQLALFNRLGEIAGNVVWVGDRKQSIYKFRDCDPDLMDHAYLALEKTAEEADLPNCYRSRKPLVDFCSAVFAHTFDNIGCSEKEFDLGAPRGEPEGLPPPVEVWSLESTNKDTDTSLIAEGIRQLLDSTDRITVVDKASEELRKIRPGDIAVLRSSNSDCAATAAALYQHGIRTSTADDGLAETPEAVYVLSALEVVLDRRAALPALLVRHLSGTGKAEEDIGEQIARVNSADGSKDNPWSSDRVLEDLRKLADAMIVRSPSEMLDLVIEKSRAREVCLRWPRAERALANLEMLRQYAARYEETCRFRQTGATTLGLLLYFRNLPSERTGEKNGRQSAEKFDDAVTVSTYHRAKGCEWPIVILGNLDRGPRKGPECRGVHVLSGEENFDPANPLKDRWIRYWPWPYGETSTKAPLYEPLAESEEEDYARGRDNRELQRLLYVGFTRARDILILPTREGKPEPTWPASLEPGLILPLDGEAGEAVRDFGGGGKVRSRLRRLTETPNPETADERAHRWFAHPEGDPPDRQPLFISPSSLKLQEPVTEDAVPAEAIVDLGEEIAIRRPRDPRDSPIGNAVHAFFAADREDLPEEQRLEIAERCRAAFDGVDNFTDRDLITAADRLYGYIRKQWPEAKLWRELPLESREGKQEIRGTADLVVETEEEINLIDHKTQPLEKAPCPAEAARYAPQLQAYAKALEKALKKPCRTSAVHFPFAGVLVEVQCRSDIPA